MVTIKTFNDFESLTGESRLNFIQAAINEYEASTEYKRAETAQSYLEGNNTGIRTYRKAVMSKTGKNLIPEASPVASRIFYRLVMQKSQYSLVNGLYLKNQELKKKLGIGFDTRLLRMGENAITHGVAYGFWNVDHMEHFSMLQFLPLVDERTSEIKAGIRFWKLDDKRPLNIELYEIDGVTELQAKDGVISEVAKQRPYITPNAQQLQQGMKPPPTIKYTQLPIFPLWANPEHQSDFTFDMQSNIDRYDRIFTDFGNNLDRTNDIYWVLANIGGDVEDVKTMLLEIQELKATYAEGEGASAMPHTIEVPYEARRVALELLNGLIISNFCGLDTAAMTGGKKTATEIRLSMLDLNNVATRFEIEAYDFAQRIIEFVTGEKTENISFKRMYIGNEAEQNNMVLAAADYLDHQTILSKLTFIDVDEIAEIMKRIDEERYKEADASFPLAINQDVDDDE